MSGQQSSEKAQQKVDIKKLVAVVPPPTMLFGGKAKKVREKRIRLRYDNSVKPDEAKISKRLAEELGIKDMLEITVAGKKRFRFKAIIIDSALGDYVFVNPDLMKENGIADNSICTIRSVASG
ncbi:MAG: hypothetical protein DRO12_03835 [Thermoprotei archaeon]|nr:MAG: hypothetical protein DRO12_03835 [Thermoprotei archaeon]